MTKADYGDQCRKNVWLRKDGSCQFRYSSSSVSKTWDTETNKLANTLATASLVLGILSMLFSPWINFLLQVIILFSMAAGELIGNFAWCDCNGSWLCCSVGWFGNWHNCFEETDS